METFVKKSSRVISMIVASFLIACAMTRFINLRASAIPKWMAGLVRSALEALGDDGFGIESIIDGSNLGKLLMSWLLATIIMYVSRRLTRNFLRHAALFFAGSMGSFAGAYYLAHLANADLIAPGHSGWLHERLVSPGGAAPNDFQVLYVLALLVICWLGMLSVLFALYAVVARRGSHHAKERPKKVE
jgi:hypothetical protein